MDSERPRLELVRPPAAAARQTPPEAVLNALGCTLRNILIERKIGGLEAERLFCVLLRDCLSGRLDHGFRPECGTEGDALDPTDAHGWFATVVTWIDKAVVKMLTQDELLDYYERVRDHCARRVASIDAARAG